MARRTPVSLTDPAAPARLDGVPEPVDDRRRRPVRAASAAPVPGERVGPYRIEYEFGAGGMGRVYAARHRGTGAPVAIKVLRHPQGTGPLDGASGRRRLYREAIALSRVRHPNVPALLAVDTDPRLGPYVVLERVEGLPLTRWRQAEAPSLARILSVVVQVARALAACHDAGLVHRDVKPSNVLVEPSGRAVLVDFGLAIRPRPADAGVGTGDDPLDGRITDVGTVLGTNGYIAPELILGGPVTFAADQFSLAVVLFEALCGRRPFEGATAVAYARAVRSGARRPLARDDVPPRIVRLLDRALSVDPAARFDAMHRVVAELEAAARSLRRSVVHAALHRARSWWRSRRDPLVPPAPASAAAATTAGVLGTTEVQSVELL